MLVPGAGLEPARPCGRGILSPLCLPVSPPGHGDDCTHSAQGRREEPPSAGHRIRAGDPTASETDDGELLRIPAGFRCGWFGFGDALHDRGRIVIGAHFRALGFDRRKTARPRLLAARAAFFLPLKHATPGKPAHRIQGACEGNDERQGYGEVHDPRVCLSAPDWRKGSMTWRRRTATDGAQVADRSRFPEDTRE